MLKRLLTNGLLLLAMITATAQEASLSMYDLSALPLRVPVLAGKAGNSIMVMDIGELQGTPLYILDTNYTLIKKLVLPKEVSGANMALIGHSLRFIWPPQRSNANSDTILLKMLQVNESGLVTDLGNLVTKRGSGNRLPQIITDKNHQYQLVFSLETDSSELAIKGLLLDSLGNIHKNLAYSFDFDYFKNQPPMVILDTRGNVHIAVADRLSNYRITSKVTINTIPFAEENIITESFEFEKVKFNKLFISDDPETARIRLQGFYYDSGERNRKKGIASLSFTYNRGGSVMPRFNPFPENLRMDLQKGMRHLRKKDDIFNSISFKNISEENGETLLSYWVQDISELDIPGDYETDLENLPGRQGVIGINRPGPVSLSAAQTQAATVARWLDDSQRLNSRAENNPLNLTRFPGMMPNSNNGFSEPSLVNPVVGNGLSEADRSRIYAEMDRSYNKTSRNIKLISFLLDKQGFLKKQEMIGSEFFTYQPSLKQVSYTFMGDGQVYFGADGPMQESGNPVSLVMPGSQGNPIVKKYNFPLETQAILMSPKKLGTGDYALLVNNTNSRLFNVLSIHFGGK